MLAGLIHSTIKIGFQALLIDDEYIANLAQLVRANPPLREKYLRKILPLSILLVDWDDRRKTARLRPIEGGTGSAG